MNPASVEVFGIRHHGPGSARSLESALAEFAPDAVLIEGPADADPIVALVAEGMQPPVALLAYRPERPTTASFWPFAVFSPEWRALRYGLEARVPVSFCDLPAAHVLAFGDECAGPVRDPLDELADIAGYPDSEQWWDAVVESHTGADVFDTVLTAMTALRETAATEPDGIDELTLIREAYMRHVLGTTLEGGATRVAVVCGAWHAPALSGTLAPVAQDDLLLAGLPEVAAALTWVPWTHSRLATASGYGAGITSPGWYHHLFTEPERPLASWMAKTGQWLRERDLPASSAHIIDAVRLATTLATLRGRRPAGLAEASDAILAVLCDGDETMLRWVTRELVVGEALGAVPAHTPTVPLAADLRTQLESLGMKQQDRETTTTLDLRRTKGLGKSQLLHRLRILDVPWGEARDPAQSTGTFRESWTLRWRPEFTVSLIEAAQWGNTVQAAAEAKILDHVRSCEGSTAQITAALESALLAGLGGAVGHIIARLGEVAALERDIGQLLTALPPLIRTLRYGDVRGTDTNALRQVVEGTLARACAGLPAAVTGLGVDPATSLRKKISAVHTWVGFLETAWAAATWTQTLRALADRADVHGSLTGRMVRLLVDAREFDSTEAARRLAAALSVGRTPTEKAAWIDGFLAGNSQILVHDRDLLDLIDTWLTGLREDQFTQVLPLLRRTFGVLEPAERHAIGHAIRQDAPSRSGSQIPLHTEPCATQGAVAQLLGLPV